MIWSVGLQKRQIARDTIRMFQFAKVRKLSTATHVLSEMGKDI